MIKIMLSDIEREYKSKILNEKDKLKLRKLVNSEFMKNHIILVMDKEIQEHICKYDDYDEDIDNIYLRKKNNIKL